MPQDEYQKRTLALALAYRCTGPCLQVHWPLSTGALALAYRCTGLVYRCTGPCLQVHWPLPTGALAFAYRCTGPCLQVNWPLSTGALALAYRCTGLVYSCTFPCLQVHWPLPTGALALAYRCTGPCLQVHWPCLQVHWPLPAGALALAYRCTGPCLQVHWPCLQVHWPLPTGALALIYSAAEYATPVWCRSCHTEKLDCVINNTMHIITGCLHPTETIFLPVLSGIMPPDIKREHCIAKLVTAAKENPHHLLHQQVSIAAGILSPQRLKCRRPFIRHAVSKLADNLDPMLEWNNKLSHAHPLLISACPPPSPTLPPGADLPQKHWVWLNHLRSGTALVGELLVQWGTQNSAICPC